ncbi:PREDICTED: zinc finger protein 148-like [Polistes dominula]|uniref:Zinc finger protein 148-like n=1 Tax=Polistes dominula TaxID=743375 RepID=A0ABM1IZE4_POLDO|nr:PREDICTED: zinc finger protein 148-like [Polistes dominula]
MMGTKTSYDYISNSDDTGIMGRSSPAALLDMLAEVASRTLYSEKKEMKSLLSSQCKTKSDVVKRKAQEMRLNVPQLLSMPMSQLVKQFSVLTSDELKRQFSYTCTLVDGCEQKYKSFASEGKARKSMKAHLAEHLEYFKSNEQAYYTFTTKPIKYKNFKSNLQNKSTRLHQSKKPRRILNKENKGKQTDYLHKILSNDNTNFGKFEKHKSTARTESLNSLETKKSEHIDVKVLGDHSYFEHLREEASNETEITSSDNILNDSSREENIVLMMVDTDNIRMKDYSHIKGKISDNLKHQDTGTLYISDVPWIEGSCKKKMDLSTSVKPKGKAKFIGTSKEERELALAFMDRIKKKGNPTGSNLQCHICDPPRSFTAPTTLVSHYRSHAGIKPYECRICRAVFTRRHSLKYHMLIHQNQTRFTCADCGKKFRHPSHFREHRRRHTGESPFCCNDCSQRFKTRNTYKRHLKTRHGKVLTTTGELLFLSEEDFEKVRTNRKKKIDCHDNKSTAVDEDIIATRTIMNFQDNIEPQEISNDVLEEYIINKNCDGNRINKAIDTIPIIDKYYENYDICSIPFFNKTEHLEESVSLNDNSDNNITESDRKDINRMQSNFQQNSYDNVTVIKTMENQPLLNKSLRNEHKVVCEYLDKESYVQSYYYNEHIQSSKETNNHLQVVESHHSNYKNASNFEGQNVQFVLHLTKKMELETVDKSTNCNINTVGNDEFSNSYNVIQSEEKESNVDTYIHEENSISKDNLQLHIPGEFIENSTSQNLNDVQDNLGNNILVRNVNDEPNILNFVSNEVCACIKTLPCNFILCYQENQEKLQVNESTNVTVLNKCTQGVNLIQNRKQSAILLLSNNASKNGTLQIK